MDDVKPDSEYGVFDDICGGFEFFRSYKAWLGAQYEFTVTDKYRKKQKVMWGKPTIWLSNDNPFSSGHIDHEWIIENCFVVEIERDEPLIVIR